MSISSDSFQGGSGSSTATDTVTQNSQSGSAFSTNTSGITGSGKYVHINMLDGGAVQNGFDLSRESIKKQLENSRLTAGLADSLSARQTGLMETFLGSIKDLSKQTSAAQQKVQTEAISAVRAAAGDRDMRVASERSQLTEKVITGAKWLAVIGAFAYILK